MIFYGCTCGVAPHRGLARAWTNSTNCLLLFTHFYQNEASSRQQIVKSWSYTIISDMLFLSFTNRRIAFSSCIVVLKRCIGRVVRVANLIHAFRLRFTFYWSLSGIEDSRLTLSWSSSSTRGSTLHLASPICPG